MFNPLQVAVRAYAVPEEKPRKKGQTKKAEKRTRRTHPASQRTLVFDTETSTDPSQRLNFGAWRLYIDRPNVLPGTVCVEEGIFYADDLPDRDKGGYRILAHHAMDRVANTFPGHDPRLRFLSRTEFVEQVLYRYGYRNKATIVGFNLPFDLSRLALASSESRGQFAGGNSLRLWKNERFRPRIAYKALDSRRTLIGFTAHDGKDDQFRGHFLDLRTLCFALTDRSYSLESACQAFGAPYVKRPVSHGVVTDDYVSYCREDVEATSHLYQAAIAEFRLHPIDLQATKAFSPASVGKAYMRKIGVVPILQRQPDFDPAVLAAGMEAYFGGRAESRIRKTPLPIVYTDFLSMYPTVNALTNTWELIIADRIEIDDTTEDTRLLLADPNLLEKCFTRDFWPLLRCLVEVEPDGDVLPVRAGYDPSGSDFGIGINPYRASAPTWYSLADVVASVLLTEGPPRIRSAVSLRAVGRQKGLTPIWIRGMVEANPSTGDFFRQVIELRRKVESDPGYSEDERAKLSRFLKVLANATSYGILAEYVRHEVADPVGVAVHTGSDGTFRTKSTTPETPGPYCFPPLAAIITGSARLMLALLERQVADAGGAYTFCDTDSMGIVATALGGLQLCTGGGRTLAGEDAVMALSFADVDDIVGRFALLNPYDRSVVPGSILKIEKENYEEGTTEGELGPRRQLWCWSISTKRYGLFVAPEGSPNWLPFDSGGPPEFVKATEHGLGHLLNPTDPSDGSPKWTTQAWSYLFCEEFGMQVDEPPWLDTPALTRVTVSGPTVLRWFRGYNEDRDYGDSIKPANFVLLGHRDPFDQSGLLPIAPYESNASNWASLDWLDRLTARGIAITTERFDGNVQPGVVRVRSYRDVLTSFLIHPEAKSLGPDGEPVGRRTTGLLQRRPVEGVAPLRRIGKEGNRLDDRLTGVATGPDDYLNEYVDPRRTVWRTLVVPVLATIFTQDLALQAGLHRRTIERYLSGQVTPTAAHEQLMTEIATKHAIEILTEFEFVSTFEVPVLLHNYLKTYEYLQATCLSCGGPLSGRQMKWCCGECRSNARST